MEAFIGGCCPLSSSGHLPGHGKHRCSPVPAAESQGHGRRWRRTPFGRPPCAPCPPKQWPPRRGLQWGMNKVCAVQRSGRTVETFPGCSRWDADGAGSGTAQACRTPGPVQPPLPTPTAPAALSLSLSRSEKTSDNKLAIRLCHRRAKGGRSLPPWAPHWNVHFLVRKEDWRATRFAQKSSFL